MEDLQINLLCSCFTNKVCFICCCFLRYSQYFEGDIFILLIVRHVLFDFKVEKTYEAFNECTGMVFV